MAKKTFRGRLEFKADADRTGEFRAVFATLNVIDHDEDVTVPGAFQAGQETPIEAWNHNYGVLPVGKGVIREEEEQAIVDGRFFLDTPSGLEHYQVVKALGSLQEWSYTFEILEAGFGKFEDRDVRFLRKMDVWGVAPVQRGAGIDTRTLDIKGLREALQDRKGVQELHDMLVSLGATCEEGAHAGAPQRDSGGGGEGEDQGKAGDGKSRSPGRDTLAARVALELLEAGYDVEGSQ